MFFGTPLYVTIVGFCPEDSLPPCWWAKDLERDRQLTCDALSCQSIERMHRCHLLEYWNVDGFSMRLGGQHQHLADRLADRFFDPSNRAAICSLILNEEDCENYSTFLSLMNIILTVAQSVNATKKVRIDALKGLGIELMLHLKNVFINEKGLSWVMIILSFHQTCAHSWELFKWNGGHSIAKWSESLVGSWNKHVRSFQSGPDARSRQLSVKDNIHNIFHRMLIMSHPEIASKRPRPSCSVCDEVGRTAQSSKHTKVSVLSEEQARIELMYY